MSSCSFYYLIGANHTEFGRSIVVEKSQETIKLYSRSTAQNFTVDLGIAQKQVQVRLLDLSGQLIREYIALLLVLF